MQEGMWSLVQMAKSVEARGWHAAAGLVHITLLTSPTTGGVYASFASLADVILAEAEAQVGFAGPRVIEELTGTQPGADVHTAEFAFEHGLVDAIVPRAGQRETVAKALRALSVAPRAREQTGEGGSAEAPSEQLTAWQRLQLVRDPARPSGPQILDALLRDAVDLRGDRTGGDDDHVVVRVGHLAASSRNVVGIAQDANRDGRIRPAGFRKAVRAIELAGRLGLPVLTVIHTRGADPLPGSEAGGIAAAIARTYDAMLSCPTPTLAVVSGEGGSGGALAMCVADRVVAFSNAVFSVIAPEGAAAILYRDAGRAPELAETLRIGVADLIDLGLVDVAVSEPAGGVQANPQVAMQNLARTVGSEVDRLAAARPRRRSMHRHRRWRSVGVATAWPRAWNAGRGGR